MLYSFFTICFFIILCSLFIKQRIFKQSYNIHLTTEELEPYYFLFKTLFFTSFIILLLLIISTIIKLNVLDTKKENYLNIKQGVNFLFKYYNIIFNSLKNIFITGYGKVFNFLGPKYTYNIIKLAKLWPKLKKYYSIIIFTFEILPRLVIITVFIFEIYFKQLHYYFFVLILLIIPLIFRFIIFMLNDIGIRLLPEYTQYLVFSPKQNLTLLQNGIQKEYSFIPIKLKQQFEQELDLNSLLTLFFYPLFFIESEITVHFFPLYNKLKKIGLFIYYFFTLLGVCYILYVFF